MKQYGETTLRFLLEPIERELADPHVTEIVVNRPGEVGIERAGKWYFRSVPEFDEAILTAIALLASRGKSDRDTPLCNTFLPDGHRLQVCHPPATPEGVIALCIRKPPARARMIDDDDFDGLFTETNTTRSRSREYDDELGHLLRAKDYRAFFKLARKARKCIDVCGQTGSGKTDFLRRLIQESDPDTRAVTIETDPEFGSIGPHNRVSLFFNEDVPALAPANIIKAALRLRPDEIWFQETRGAEAWFVLRARASGHRGGGTSWHAKAGEEVDALMLMLRQYPPVAAMPDKRLRALCLQHIDILVWCDRTAEGYRAPRIWLNTGEAT